MVRLYAVLLLLLANAVAAEPRSMEGSYRYGHEVNAVCFGDPEACYWLVDTAAEIRQQLRQRAAEVAPYTPVCLRLVAEILPQKAAGFGQDYDGSVRVTELTGSSAGQTGASAASPGGKRLQDLQHRRWVLERIDGMELDEFARELGFGPDEVAAAKQPDLDFGAQGFVSGNTGCNQIQGQARVVDNQLILSQVAATAMLCAGFAGELELQLQLIYRNPMTIARDASDLLLRATGRELRYRLRDWVQ